VLIFVWLLIFGWFSFVFVVRCGVLVIVFVRVFVYFWVW